MTTTAPPPAAPLRPLAAWAARHPLPAAGILAALWTLAGDLLRLATSLGWNPLLRVDDWIDPVVGGLSLSAAWYSGALLVALLPTLLRGVRAILLNPPLIARLCIYFMILGILAAIATPNFNRARMQSRELGLAVGGAKDIDTFRENLAAGHLPQPSDLTYEGLFYDYRFDTPRAIGTSEALFAPACSAAVSRDPESGSLETWLSVGLRSNLDAATFDRKALNLVVCLDVSGSMGARFTDYYYDTLRPAARDTEEEWRMTKLDLAARSLGLFIDHLRPGDRLGIVLFDHRARVAKPLNPVEVTDLAALKRHLLGLRPGGGTNMEEGYRLATSLLLPRAGDDPERHENRILFLTDAMPNVWSRSDAEEDPDGEAGDLVGLGRRNAARRIHSTFLGIGLDFNTELVERLTKIRGANYASIHSPEDFRRRLDREFDGLVTPLVFDLSLSLRGAGLALEGIYGSPEAGRSTGEILRVSTLFPAPTGDDGVQGGLVLVKLRRDRPAEATEARFTVRYHDRAGRETIASLPFRLPPATAERFDDTAVRKGIALARYATLAKEWLEATAAAAPAKDPSLGRWERPSTPLAVPASFRARFAALARWFEGETRAVGDPSMRRELEVMNTIAAFDTARR